MCKLRVQIRILIRTIVHVCSAVTGGYIGMLNVNTACLRLTDEKKLSDDVRTCGVWCLI